MEPTNRAILEVKDLHTYFFTKQGIGKAVTGVSFRVPRGETVGLVGESGCGKSITALSILRLVPKPAARIIRGQILLNGEDLLQKSEAEMRDYRGRHISMILQDPMTALNPVFHIGEQVMEPIRIHQHMQKNPLRMRAIEILRLLRVPAAEARLHSYPHEFSGGMRQRVVGAIALSCQPELLIADEPTTSLDVTVQAQYLNLLRKIQRDQGLSIIFITHDFGIVARMCDWVAVMYAGRVVEMAKVQHLFRNPVHPYTQALLNSVPVIGGPAKKRLYSIEGQPPSIYHLPQGCTFAPRCEHAAERCREKYPPEVSMGLDHSSSCWELA
jgi:oligopeptide/dipeptide ABC transporter ATP-binding protein